jgi:hypothetical protein
MARVKITSDGTPLGTAVRLDGRDVGDICSSVRIVMVPGHAARVQLELVDVELDVSTDDVVVTGGIDG